MNRFTLTCATLIALSASAFAQTATPTTDTTTATPVPSWQAICGYKWRQYRLSHAEASGRDAYYLFMRTPSAEGGCGAGETTRTRRVQTRPQDAAIKAYIDAHTPAAQ